VVVCDAGVALATVDVHGLVAWAAVVVIYDVKDTRVAPRDQHSLEFRHFGAEALQALATSEVNLASFLIKAQP
jgi:hypothetical protein